MGGGTLGIYKIPGSPVAGSNLAPATKSFNELRERSNRGGPFFCWKLFMFLP